jgi:hypothetical protein
LLELTKVFVRIFVACRLLPNFNAAASVMALTSPIPYIDMNSFKDIFPGSFRLFLPSNKISFASSTALLFLLPEFMRIAINSGSLKLSLPFSNSFSRWQSSIVRFFIEVDDLLVVSII